MSTIFATVWVKLCSCLGSSSDKVISKSSVPVCTVPEVSYQHCFDARIWIFEDIWLP